MQGLDLTGTERPALLLRLLARAQPREGWLILLLAWAAVISLPMAAIEGRLLAGIGVTFGLSSLGLVAGWWLGHRRWPGLIALPVTVATGSVATLVLGVYVLNPWPLLGQSVRWLAWGLSCGVWPRCAVPSPALTAFADQAGQLSAFFQRVSWWVGGAISGRGVPDNLVVVGFAALLAWSLAAWAGWWLARHGRVFLALLPTGFLLPQQVYNADAGQAWLLVFLAALTCLMVMVRSYHLMRAWDAAGVDYSGELQLDTAIVAIGLTTLVVALAPLVPSLSLRQISEAFWRRFEEPYRQVEERMSASFPGIESRRSLVPPTGVAAGGMPRAHLLGGQPELGQEVALRVQARGVPPGQPLYWRGQTFSYYTGRGWREGADDPNYSRQTVSLAAGQPWVDELPAGRIMVLSSVEVVQASRSVMYGAGEPISADRPYEAVLRAPGELVAIWARSGPTRYTVLGAVAEPDPRALRAAATDYPQAIRDLYLQLPADLPPEVAAYAAEVTSGAATPYDRVVAIEQALRRITYSLDVPAPPPDREVVSWFLFDLRRGYCDYTATAMVVLARLSGVPARLAIGYAPGTYDLQTDLYEVTELQAHSWPEVYFPGYGWIPFEPTAGQSAPDRVAGYGEMFEPPIGEVGLGDWEAGLAELRHLGEAEVVQARQRGAVQRAVALLALLAFGWVTAGWVALVRPPQPEPPVSWYERLARWGTRLGRPLHPAHTPREFAAELSAAAQAAAARARWRPASAARASAIVRDEAAALARTFEATLYAPPIGSPVVEREAQSWAPLWAALRRVWLARWRL